MRRVGLAVATVVALAAAGAGCGGDDGQSADEYRSELNAICTDSREALTSLPQLAADENLSIEETEARAEEISAGFEDEVDALEPPDELEDAHEELLAVEPPEKEGGAEALIAFSENLSSIYAELGAAECEQAQQETIDLLEDDPSVVEGGEPVAP